MQPALLLSIKLGCSATMACISRQTERSHGLPFTRVPKPCAILWKRDYTQPSYSINQTNTFGGGGIGIWGTLPTGSTVMGGIITAAGSGTVTGDVTGTLSGTTLSQIQTVPVVLSGLTSGDVLSYNGVDWINTPAGGTPYQITRAGGSVVVGAGGGITSTPAAGQANSFTPPPGVMSTSRGPATCIRRPMGGQLTGCTLMSRVES